MLFVLFARKNCHYHEALSSGSPILLHSGEENIFRLALKTECLEHLEIMRSQIGDTGYARFNIFIQSSVEVF